jgi:hypothetical protein
VPRIPAAVASVITGASNPLLPIWMSFWIPSMGFTPGPGSRSIPSPPLPTMSFAVMRFLRAE